MNLVWNKCQGDQWCQFSAVDLNHEHFRGMSGVYVIWHGGNTPRTVYVGRGEIAARIREHRNDPRITQYETHRMFVTWAKVSADSQAGVEAYLITKLKPLVNHLQPTDQWIQVNYPW